MIPIQHQLNGIFIPTWLLQVNSITNSAKIAYCVLLTHTKSNGKLMLDVPGMADVMGTTTTRFLSHLNELCRGKLIKRTETKITFLEPQLNAMKSTDISMPAISQITTPALSSRGSHLNPDWTPPIEDVEVIKEQFPLVDIKLEHEKFVDYWLSKPGKGGIKKDWIRVWKNWMRQAEQYRRSRENNNRSSSEVRSEKFDDGIEAFR